VTILESDQLTTAQDATKLLRFVADWIWVLALAAAAGAVWLARGRRRREVRALALGILIAGVLILIARTLIGRYLVDELVVSDSVRPAVANAYDILTNLLRGAGRTALLIAVVALVGLWVSGPRPRAVRARRALAPYLRRPLPRRAARRLRRHGLAQAARARRGQGGSCAGADQAHAGVAAELRRARA
jgi:hypothetical protein